MSAFKSEKQRYLICHYDIVDSHYFLSTFDWKFKGKRSLFQYDCCVTLLLMHSDGFKEHVVRHERKAIRNARYLCYAREFYIIFRNHILLRRLRNPGKVYYALFCSVSYCLSEGSRPLSQCNVRVRGKRASCAIRRGSTFVLRIGLCM